MVSVGGVGNVIAYVVRVVCLCRYRASVGGMGDMLACLALVVCYYYCYCYY